MLRLLLLLGLPFAVYAYWRYLARATPEQRKKRTEVLLWGLLGIIGMVLVIRGGSFLAAGIGALALGLLRWLPRLGWMYLSRKAEPAAQPHAPPNAAPSPGRMTEPEALAILGLDPGASRAQIQERYKQLMRNVHPDRGGSDYLASQINRARDVLLAERPKARKS